eukprot:5651441-Alexandrium_andersonii.AAC.1
MCARSSPTSSGAQRRSGAPQPPSGAPHANCTRGLLTDALKLFSQARALSHTLGSTQLSSGALNRLGGSPTPTRALQ